MEKSLHHITWRCHDRQFYFDSPEIKAKVLKIIARYKKRYNIRIFDYVLMSNHAHFLVYIDSLVNFSDFMRTTNSMIAKLINKVHQKTSQAISDRYRSPVIQDEHYLINTIAYVWMNPFRASMIDLNTLEDYRFCSLYTRSRGIDDPLLDDYSLLGELVGYDPSEGEGSQKFVRDYLNRLKSEHSAIDFASAVYEHLHSVGDEGFMRGRKSRLTWCSVGPP